MGVSRSFRSAWMTVVAVAVVLSVLLAACSGGGNAGSQSAGTQSGAGGGTGTGSTPAATSTPAASTPAPSEEPAPQFDTFEHITMFAPAGKVPQDLDLINQTISEYIKDKLNADFQLNIIEWGGWRDTINLKIASNEEFDIVWTANWDNFASRVQQGAFLPLNDLIDKYAPDAKAVIPPALLEGGVFPDGYNYGLPVNKEIGSQRGVLLRKDLLDKYNLDPKSIKKLEDLEAFFEVIKNNEPDVVPFYTQKDSVTANSILDVKNFIELHTFAVLRREADDYKVILKYEDPLFLEGLKLQRKWFEAGYVNKDAATITDFSGGIKAGKAFSFAEWLKPGKDAEVSASSDFDWVQVELTTPFISTSDTLGSMMSISRTSSDPERAMRFLNMLYHDEYLLNLLVFGIEGQHYVKVEGKDNIIKLPDGLTPQTSGYNLGTAYMFGNQFLDYLWENEDPQKWEKFKAFNESAEASRVLGFIFNTEPVKNEIAAFNNVKDQYGPGLLSGSLDPEQYLPEFISKVKAIGGDKIVAEVQKQLDEWLTARGKN